QRCDRRRRGGEGTPASAYGQHNRNKQSELRLVCNAAEQQSGKNGLAIELQQSGTEQCRREEAVVAVAEVDEHRGKPNDERKPQRVVEGASTAGVQDRANRKKIKDEGYALPKGE